MDLVGFNGQYTVSPFALRFTELIVYSESRSLLELVTRSCTTLSIQLRQCKMGSRETGGENHSATVLGVFS
jgi:hypothetical protein